MMASVNTKDGKGKHETPKIQYGEHVMDLVKERAQVMIAKWDVDRVMATANKIYAALESRSHEGGNTMLTAAAVFRLARYAEHAFSVFQTHKEFKVRQIALDQKCMEIAEAIGISEYFVPQITRAYMHEGDHSRDKMIADKAVELLRDAQGTGVLLQISTFTTYRDYIEMSERRAVSAVKLAAELLGIDVPDSGSGKQLLGHYSVDDYAALWNRYGGAHVE